MLHYYYVLAALVAFTDNTNKLKSTNMTQKAKYAEGEIKQRGRSQLEIHI